jgi:hypothetical protein
VLWKYFPTLKGMIPTSTEFVFLMKQHFMSEQSEAQLPCLGEWKSSWSYWDLPKVNVWCAVMRNNIICHFFFWRTNGDWWKVPICEVVNFASHSCRNSFPVRRCAPPHFSHHVYAFLDRQPNSMTSSFSRSYLDFLFEGFVKDIIYWEKVQKCEWIAWKNC